MSEPRYHSVHAVRAVARTLAGAPRLVGLVLCAGVTLAAQQSVQPASEQHPVFRASTDLVTIDAVVTDGDGKPVTDLTRDDFEVTVAGKRQTLEQAVYIRVQDQPRELAAVRAAAVPPDRPENAPALSAASRTLRTTGPSPDRIARTIAIVVDDLGLSFESMYYVRRAVRQYIDTQMEPGDLVAVIRTAGGVGALQQFTTDKRLLHLAADHLRWDFRSRHGVATFEAATENLPAGLGTEAVDSLRDTMASVGSLAALEFISRGVAELPGRKCVIYFSEGFPSIFEDRKGSERLWHAMARMLTRANTAGVVIYTIDARGLQTGGLGAVDNPITRDWGPGGTMGPSGASGAPSGSNTGGSGGGASGGGSGGSGGGAAGGGSGAGAPTPTVGSGAGFLDVASANIRSAGDDRLANIIDSQESLKFLADQTGGLAIANTNDLNLGIKRVLDDQKGYYLLGYTAPKGAPHGGWDQDRVKVRVKRPGVHIRARQGFFGPFDTREPAVAPVDPLVTSALSPFGAGGVSVRLTSLFARDTKTGPYVRSLLFIDPADLSFGVDATGRHTARFQVLLMAVGDNGQVLDGWRREVPLALTDGTFRLIGERGIVVTVRTPVKDPGPYQMRAAVEDLATKAVGSASQFLEVPRVGRGKLALSGVLLKGTAGSSTTIHEEAAPDKSSGLVDGVLFEPEVRVLSPGMRAVYAYEIYDGLKGSDPALQMSAAVIRDGKVVYQSPFAPVTATHPPSGGSVRTIPIAGTLNLGDNMPAGPYTLEVTVRRGDSKKLERKQWLDFEIRR